MKSPHKIAIRALLLTAITVLSAQGQTQELSPAARLRKLSLAIRGTIPSLQEFEEVNKLNPSNQELYFKEKTASYMTTAAHVEKMQQRLQGLFRVRHSDRLKLDIAGIDPTTRANRTSENTMDQIFIQTIQKNESWDNLLKTKSFEVFYQSTTGATSDAGFLKAVFPDQIKSSSDGVLTKEEYFNPSSEMDYDENSSQSVTANTDDQKLVTAGALTTSRFFNRYPTTKLNKNRKRAAAVFRIFLCDDMRPVVVPGENENLELLALAFNENGEHSDPKIQDQEQRHGTAPDCMACHYKLDPLGQTFRTSTVVLNSRPAPGALVFKGDDDRMVNIPVKGIGEIAEAITAQPEYAKCQVQHFWNWFIGQDVLLSDEKMQELVMVFNENDRRPNDFIQHLVSRPEFRKPPKADEKIITISHLKNIFRKCNDCHANEGHIPDFDRLPIGGSLKSHKTWVTDIAKELDLAHGGKDAKMPPPAKTDWRLTDRDRDLLTTWMLTGAKDEKGKPTIDDDFILSLGLNGTANKTEELIATFDDTFLRYFENHDLFRVLDQFFGVEWNRLDQCDTIDRDNRAVLGSKSPVDGRPIFQTPSPTYIKILQSCVLKGFTQRIGFDANGSARRRGSFVLINPRLARDRKFEPSAFAQLNWLELKPQEKRAQVTFIVFQLIGRGVLYTESLSNLVNGAVLAIDKYALQIKKENRMVNVQLATGWATGLITTNERFLTY